MLLTLQAMAARFAQFQKMNCQVYLMKKNAENMTKAKKTAMNVFRLYPEAKEIKIDDVLASFFMYFLL